MYFVNKKSDIPVEFNQLLHQPMNLNIYPNDNLSISLKSPSYPSISIYLYLYLYPYLYLYHLVLFYVCNSQNQSKMKKLMQTNFKCLLNV